MLDTVMPDALLLAELRDGLRRKQRELPLRLLAHVDEGLLASTYLKPTVGQIAVERVVMEDALAAPGTLEGMSRPALVVEHAPRCSDAGDAILDRMAAAGDAQAGVPAVALVDRDERLVARRRERLARRGVARPAIVAADPTMALPLPRGAPHPRLHLFPCNVLGTLGTLGAIRALRVLRASLDPGDRALLSVDVRRDGAYIAEAFATCPALAAVTLGMLEASNRELGTDFPPDAFLHSAQWDGEFSRVETTLVATRAVKVRVPGDHPMALRKGQTIRSGVHATFDRRRLTAMLDSVGLAVDGWVTDADGRVALATARIAR